MGIHRDHLDTYTATAITATIADIATHIHRTQTRPTAATAYIPTAITATIAAIATTITHLHNATNWTYTTTICYISTTSSITSIRFHTNTPSLPPTTATKTLPK